MKKYKTRIHIRIIIFFVLAVLAVGGFPSAIIPNTGMIASADSVHTRYSTVREDLSKDPDFDIADYPEDNTDYSVQVIQIAESTDGELFVYVYRPYALFCDMRVTSISISVTINESYRPKLFQLRELSSSGVLGKYLVQGLTVESQDIRYYEISEIFRVWDSRFDNTAGGAGTVISEVSYAVGKLFTAQTVGNTVTYECDYRETIEIINPVHGSLRYLNGFSLFPESCDSWFVAFSTDKKIDKLLGATVYYVSRFYIWEFGIKTGDSGPRDEYIDITDKDKGKNLPKWWYKGKLREWNRIESVSSFLKNESLNSSLKKEVEKCEWVLRFEETEYTDAYVAKMYTEISNISILRLEFQTNGRVYNLGAVDRKSTPDNIPDNPISDRVGFDFWEWLVDFFNRLFTGDLEWWEWLVAVFLLPALLFVLSVGVFLLLWVFRLVKFIVNRILGLFHKNE